MKTFTEAEQKTSSKAIANNSKLIKPVLLKGLALQTQLKIGKPNDRYEQEADRVADQVMSMPEGAIQSQPIEEEEEELMPKIQMQIEEEEEPVQMKRMIQLQPVEEEEEMMPKLQMQEEEEELLQAQTVETVSNNKSPKWVQKNINSSKGRGSLLPPNTRSFMENRFGVDFSDVNIHTGSTAVQMNRTLGAQAFTTGKEIFFNRDKFHPESSSGKHLLAHELTHVIQQNKMSSVQRKRIQRQTEKSAWKKDEKKFKAVVLSLDPKKPNNNSEKFKESIEKTLGTLGKEKMRNALFNKLKLNSNGQLLLSIIGVSGYTFHSLGKGKIPALDYNYKVKDNTWLTISTGGDFKKPKLMIGLKVKF